METNLKFNSAICTTREQSERLLDLGLKKETADMYYTESPRLLFIRDKGIPLEEEDFPAWSLHRLLCLLPTEYIYDIDFQRIMQDFIFRSHDMYEEAIGCIEALIEEGYFYEEYLEE